MNKISLTAVTLSLLLSTSAPLALASTAPLKEFKFEGDTIHTVVPEGWEALNGFMNVPVQLVSAKGSQDQRSVIQIIPVGDQEDVKEFTKAEKDPQDYYASKEEYIHGLGGEAKVREPYIETKKDGLMRAQIGVKYTSAHGEFLDETHYVQTKSGKFFFIKDLIPLDQPEHRAIVSEVIDQVSAKN